MASQKHALCETYGTNLYARISYFRLQKEVLRRTPQNRQNLVGKKTGGSVILYILTLCFLCIYVRTQECLYYGEPASSVGEYYCADVCDPSPCAEGETCNLVEVTCVRSPCPPFAECTPTITSPTPEPSTSVPVSRK